MRINNATLDLLKEFEGCRLESYRDVAGIWTIGWGHADTSPNPPRVTPGMTITQQEADDIFEIDLNYFAEGVKLRVQKPINENEYGAFVSLAYNIGINAFARSTALKNFNEGQRRSAADAILMWNKAGGKVVPGLERRREAERALFLTPVEEPIKETAKASKSLTREMMDALDTKVWTVLAGVGVYFTDRFIDKETGEPYSDFDLGPWALVFVPIALFLLVFIENRRRSLKR